MRIRNQRDLDLRLKQLNESTAAKRSSLLATSDHTRQVAGSVQQGLYASQLALSLFRNVTNYHIPIRKRIFKVITSIVTLLLLNALRKRFVKK